MSNDTLSKNESHRIEFKRELTPDLGLEKEVVAFLNYPEGGVILLGVDAAGNALDIKDIDSDMLKIKDRIKHNIAPSAMGLFDVVTQELQGKEVLTPSKSTGSFAQSR